MLCGEEIRSTGLNEPVLVTASVTKPLPDASVSAYDII